MQPSNILEDSSTLKQSQMLTPLGDGLTTMLIENTVNPFSANVS
jgi:hypothetical protein